MDNHLKEAKEFFDKMAPKWDTFSINNPEGVKMTVSMAGLRENAKVADIACGTGVLFNDILLKNPSELWGIDISEKMLEQAALKHKEECIHFYAGAFEDFKEKDFDCAFVYRAYPHFPDKKVFALKLHSILKDGGRFIIAHSESRKAVNDRHAGGAAHVSDILAPVSEEMKNFTELFDVDITADTDYLYIISGTKIPF